MTPTFSVIIPTLNEEHYINKLLKSIKTQSLQPKEIIIVDGSSTDKTTKIVKKYPQIKLLKSTPQVALQRNLGAKTASSELIYFLDADTILPKDFFSSTIKQFNNSTIKIDCPYYFPYKSNRAIFSVYLFFNLMFFLFQKISPSGAGSCIILNKKFFTQLNGFNPKVKFEDIELIRRASKKGTFKMLPTYIWVSDRRFKKYGTTKTTIQYLVLSFLFLINQFNYSPFSYQFGKYFITSTSPRPSPQRRGRHMPFLRRQESN